VAEIVPRGASPESEDDPPRATQRAALPITANKNCNLAVFDVSFRQYAQAMKMAISR